MAAPSELTRAELDRQGESRAYRAGEPLARVDDARADFILLTRGHARLWRRRASGEAVTLAYLYAGDLFGLAGAARDRSYGVNLSAASDVAALVWSAAVVRDLLARDPGFAAGVATLLTAQAAPADKPHFGRVRLDAEQRVARTLVRLRATVGEGENGRPARLAVSQARVAALAQTGVPTVARLLRDWDARGLLEIGRGEIVIRDLHRVAAAGAAA